MASAVFQGVSAYDDVVDRICSKNEEDWGEIMTLCDRIDADKTKGATEVLKAIVKKIPNANPKVGGLAVTLLRACFNNCGKSFQVECAQPALMDEIKRLLETKANTPYKVCEALKEMLQDWILDYGADASLSRIYSTYNKLKADGYSFPETTRVFPQPPLSSYASTDELAAREEADLARALAESLKDTEAAQSKPLTKKKSKRKSEVYPDVDTAVSKANPGTAATPSQRHVKALYTFDVQEAGELGFKAGEIVTLVDDSHPDWWKGELRGEVGLFPSNYVEIVHESVTKDVPPTAAPGGVNEAALVDDLLEKLLTAQTMATDAAFNTEIERLYDIVVGHVQPSVLRRVDQLSAKEMELSRLNESFCTSMAMYERLQREGELALGGGHQQYYPPGYGAGQPLPPAPPRY